MPLCGICVSRHVQGQHVCPHRHVYGIRQGLHPQYMDWLRSASAKGMLITSSVTAGAAGSASRTLRKRGKCWYLDFAFEEKIGLPDTEACGRRILAVDLGNNSACTCCVMGPDGTVTGRSFKNSPERTTVWTGQ